MKNCQLSFYCFPLWQGGEIRLYDALATLRKRRRCYILLAAAIKITETFFTSFAVAFSILSVKKN